MSSELAAGLDDLSSLAAELKNVERQHIPGDFWLEEARSALVLNLQSYRNSRFHPGRVLREYRRHYKVERGWQAAARVIAVYLHCDERTVSRIIKDYERVAKLQEVIVEAMEQEHCDPAAMRNAPIVEELQSQPPPSSREEASEIVAAAISHHRTRRRRARRNKPEAAENIANRILGVIRKWAVILPPENRQSETGFVLNAVAKGLGFDIDIHRLIPLKEAKPTDQAKAA
jgi:hypothetical protein